MLRESQKEWEISFLKMSENPADVSLHCNTSIILIEMQTHVAGRLYTPQLF